MSGRDLERRLRSYRPAGPPPRLRARVVATATVRPRVWPWVAAAAALLALTVGLHVASTGTAGFETAAAFSDAAVAWPQGDSLEALRTVYGDDLTLVLPQAQRLAAQEDADATASWTAPWR